MDEEILPARGARFGARHPAASRRVGRAAHCRLGTLEGRSCRAVHGLARPPLRAGTANGGYRDQCRRPNRKSPARTRSGRAVLSYTVWSWSRDFHASPEIIPPDRHAHSQRLPGNECRTAPTGRHGAARATGVGTTHRRRFRASLPSCLCYMLPFDLGLRRSCTRSTSSMR